MNYFVTGTILTTIIWAIILIVSMVLLANKEHGFILTTLIACIDSVTRLQKEPEKRKN